MTYKIIRRLDGLRIKEYGEMVGRTITATYNDGDEELYIVFDSGQWALLGIEEWNDGPSLALQEYATGSDHSVTGDDHIGILHRLGIVSDAEMADWKAHRKAIKGRYDNLNREQEIELLRQLAAKYPEVLKP